MSTIVTTTVLNIVKLKELPIPISNGTLVYVEGYHYGEIVPLPSDPTQSYPAPMDSGGGFFRYDANSKTQPDLGVNFKPDDLNDDCPGRWVRQYDGYINVDYFGMVKHPQYYAPTGPANHERLQAAIDYCYQNTREPYVNPPAPFVDSTPLGRFTIYFPEGVYWMQPTESLILRSRTFIKGDSAAFIRLQNVDIDYLFRIDKGSVQNLTLESLRFDLGAELENLPPNPTGFFHIKAEFPDPVSPNPNEEEEEEEERSGGLFIANLRDLYVQNVGNHGIFFEGGQIDPNVPQPQVPEGELPEPARKCNQWVYLENVWMEKRYDYLSAFRMEGYNVNLSFINCNPFLPLAAYNTVKPTIRGAAFYIDSLFPHSPANNCNIVFSGCDAGGAPKWPGEFGFYIRNARNIVIENSWIEDSETGIYLENSKAISIVDNHFANAAAHGSLKTYLFDPTRESACIIAIDSFITVERNHVDVSNPHAEYVYNERFIKGLSNPNSGIHNNVINSSNNYFNHQILSQTYGIVQPAIIKQVTSRFLNPLPTTPPPIPPSQISGIDIDAKKVVFVAVGNDGSDIYRINSTINAGELLHIRAETGNITFHQMGLPEYGGRNVSLSFGSTVVLQVGHVATFVKMDNPNGWETSCYQLLSIY